MKSCLLAIVGILLGIHSAWGQAESHRVDILKGRADSCMQAGDYDRALDLYMQVEKLAGDGSTVDLWLHGDALFNIAGIYMQMEKFGEAIDYYRKSTRQLLKTDQAFRLHPADGLIRLDILFSLCLSSSRAGELLFSTQPATLENHKQVEEDYRVALAYADTLLSDTSAMRIAGNALGNLKVDFLKKAGFLYFQSYVADGNKVVACFREASEWSEKLNGKWSPEHVDCLLTLGYTLHANGQFREVIALVDELYDYYKTRVEGNESLFTGILELKITVYGDENKEIASQTARQLKDLIEASEGKESGNYFSALSRCVIYCEDNDLKLQYLKEKKDIAERLYGKKSPQYVEVLKDLGTRYYFKGEKRTQEEVELAMSCFREGMEILQEMQAVNTELYASILWGQADVYKYCLKDNIRSDSCRRQAVDIRFDLLDRTGMDWLDEAQAFAYDCMQVVPDKALSIFEMIREEQEREPLDKKNAPARYFTGVGIINVYTVKKEFDKALEYAMKQLDLFTSEPIRDTVNTLYASALGHVGKCCSYLFKRKEAMSYYERSLQVYRDALPKFWERYNDPQRVVDTDSYIHITDKLCDLYGDQGLWSRSMACWENILSFLKEHPEMKFGTSDRYLSVLCELGNISSREKDGGNVKEGKAYNYYKEALDATREKYGEEAIEYAGILSRMGRLFWEHDEYAEAEKIYPRVAGIREKILGQVHPSYIEALEDWSSLYDDGALNDKERYFPLREKIYDLTCRLYGDTHVESVEVLNGICRDYFDRQDYDRAIAWGMKGEEIARKIRQDEQLYDWFGVYEVLLFSHYYKGDWAAAMKYCDRFYGSYVPRLKQYVAHAGNNSIVSELKKQAIVLDIAMHQKAFDTKFTGFIYNMSLLFKGAALKASIELSQIIKECGDASLINSYAQLEQIGRELKQVDIARDRERFGYLTRLSWEMDMRVIEQAQQYGFDTRFLDLTWKDIQKKLDANAVAIEFENYPCGKDEVMYLALLLKKGWEHPRMIPLFKKSSLDSLSLDGISFWQALTSERGKDELYGSLALGKMVWGALMPYLNGVKQVYFSPSGVFHQVAIEYLPVSGDKTPFMEKYNAYRLTSTRELVMEKGNEQLNSAVVYGGLRYDMNANELERQRERLLTAGKESEQDTLEQDVVRSLSRANLTASYLPQTKVEAREVYTNLSDRKVNAMLYSDYAGIEETVKSLSGKKIDLLHIATHGFYFSEQEQELVPVLKGNSLQENHEDKSLKRAGLLFSGAAQALRGVKLAEGVEDGILTAKEVTQLDLRGLELVVLSACQTGLGEVTDEGVFGLQRGFKKAGAQTLLMSLWSVDDRATQVMMTQFYKNLLAGNSKREAFSKARQFLKNYTYEVEEEVEDKSQKPVFDPVLQVDVYPKKRVTTKKDFRSPRYWAAFIMLD